PDIYRHGRYDVLVPLLGFHIPISMRGIYRHGSGQHKCQVSHGHGLLQQDKRGPGTDHSTDAQPQMRAKDHSLDGEFFIWHSAWDLGLKIFESFRSIYTEQRMIDQLNHIFYIVLMR